MGARGGAASVAQLAAARRESREATQELHKAILEANGELFDATVAAVLAGLPLSETAEAMQAGWPELDAWDMMFNVEGYLERQA